jgi:hypothetical protein
VATYAADEKMQRYRLQGVRACSTFTVLFNAPTYAVGFIDLKGQRQWVFSSLNTLALSSPREKGETLYYSKYESPNLPISPSSRDDVVVVSRVANLIEFLRNGKKIPLTRDNFTQVDGFEIAPTDELFPVVILHNKGDSATMLDHNS